MNINLTGPAVTVVVGEKKPDRPYFLFFLFFFQPVTGNKIFFKALS